jgi:hypothetical protein
MMARGSFDSGGMASRNSGFGGVHSRDSAFGRALTTQDVFGGTMPRDAHGGTMPIDAYGGTMRRSAFDDGNTPRDIFGGANTISRSSVRNAGDLRLGTGMMSSDRRRGGTLNDDLFSNNNPFMFGQY